MNVIHTGPYTILSLVDEEVIGRVERDEERGIVIALPEHFYGGKLVEDADAIKALASYDYIILAGCRAVQLGIEMGIVDPRSVLEVNGLKYVQVMKSYF